MHDRALVSIGKVPKLVCEGSYQVRCQMMRHVLATI
jgi:hypothetical protein